MKKLAPYPAAKKKHRAKKARQRRALQLERKSLQAALGSRVAFDVYGQAWITGPDPIPLV